MSSYFMVTDLWDAIRQLCELHKDNFKVKHELKEINNEAAKYIILNMSLEAQVKELKEENEKLKQELNKAELALQERIALEFLDKGIGKIVEKAITEQGRPGGLLHK